MTYLCIARTFLFKESASEAVDCSTCSKIVRTRVVRILLGELVV